MTKDTIGKLEEAFLNGATDKEACFVAGIHPDSLYAYCEKNPDFSDRKEALKDMVKYRARTNVAQAIEAGDKPLSQWYLERKAKEEFSARSEHTGADGKDLIPEASEEIQALTQKLNELYRGTSSTSDGESSSSVGTEAQD